MKAILVIDMPKNCDECPYCGFSITEEDKRTCLFADNHIFYDFDVESGRHECCPLKPMPSKKVPVFDPNSASYDEERERSIMNEIDGYNRCIDEILGGEVEAIPVDWLLNHLPIDEVMHEYNKKLIEYLVVGWRKENETVKSAR